MRYSNIEIVEKGEADSLAMLLRALISSLCISSMKGRDECEESNQCQLNSMLGGFLLRLFKPSSIHSTTVHFVKPIISRTIGRSYFVVPHHNKSDP